MPAEVKAAAVAVTLPTYVGVESEIWLMFNTKYEVTLPTYVGVESRLLSTPRTLPGCYTPHIRGG